MVLANSSHDDCTDCTGSFSFDVFFCFDDSLSFSVFFSFYESDGAPLLKSVMLCILASHPHRLRTDTR